MKCLSVKQPWVNLTALNRKPVELRSWSRAYRGPVVLCAGAKVETRWGAKDYEAGPLGVTICIAELIDIRPINREDFALSCVKADFEEFKDWFGWHWGDIKRVSPVPVKGQLGLWEASTELRSALTA